MNALKAQRNAQTKLATGVVPVVRLKSQADAASDAATAPESSEAAAKVKKRKGSAGGSAQK